MHGGVRSRYLSMYLGTHIVGSEGRACIIRYIIPIWFLELAYMKVDEGESYTQ